MVLDQLRPWKNSEQDDEQTDAGEETATVEREVEEDFVRKTVTAKSSDLGEISITYHYMKVSDSGDAVKLYRVEDGVRRKVGEIPRREPTLVSIEGHTEETKTVTVEEEVPRSEVGEDEVIVDGE